MGIHWASFPGLSGSCYFVLPSHLVTRFASLNIHLGVFLLILAKLWISTSPLLSVVLKPQPIHITANTLRLKAPSSKIIHLSPTLHNAPPSPCIISSHTLGCHTPRRPQSKDERVTQEHAWGEGPSFLHFLLEIASVSERLQYVRIMIEAHIINVQGNFPARNACKIRPNVTIERICIKMLFCNCEVLIIFTNWDVTFIARPGRASVLRFHECKLIAVYISELLVCPRTL